MRTKRRSYCNMRAQRGGLEGEDEGERRKGKRRPKKADTLGRVERLSVVVVVGTGAACVQVCLASAGQRRPSPLALSPQLGGGDGGMAHAARHVSVGQPPGLSSCQTFPRALSTPSPRDGPCALSRQCARQPSRRKKGEKERSIAERDGGRQERKKGREEEEEEERGGARLKGRHSRPSCAALACTPPVTMGASVAEHNECKVDRRKNAMRRMMKEEKWGGSRGD
jgi:hypothetical protein